MRFSVNFKTG